MKKLLAAILSLIMVLSSLSLTAFAKEEKEELKFNSDGTFKILQVADLQDGSVAKKITKRFLIDLIEKEQPDLIALTGDNIAGYYTKTNRSVKKSIDNFMSIFEKYEIPVAIVYGNHDAEGKASREEQWDIYEKYDCFVGVRDSEELSGYGTYNLPIKASDSDKTAFNLWFFDSQTYNSDEAVGGYGCVEKDQIDWYIKTEAELTRQNGGTPVPSFAFQHIIIPEVYSVLTKVWVRNGDNITYLVDKDSFNEEDVIENNNIGYIIPAEYANDETFFSEACCPPKYTNGQADAMVNNGNVLGIAVGHDHKNCFVVPYKTLDIVQTPTTGFGSYGDLNRGARVITLNENDLSTYETHMAFFRDYYDMNDPVVYNEFVFQSESDDYSILNRIFAFFKWEYYSIIRTIKNIF